MRTPLATISSPPFPGGGIASDGGCGSGRLCAVDTVVPYESYDSCRSRDNKDKCARRQSGSPCPSPGARNIVISSIYSEISHGASPHPLDIAVPLFFAPDPQREAAAGYAGAVLISCFKRVSHDPNGRNHHAPRAALILANPRISTPPPNNRTPNKEQ